MAHILMIEDDELLRPVLVNALEQAGHVVAQAPNGLEGMRLFRTARCDLVITDIVMPVQEGVETILQLRRERPNLPIIAISGGVPNSPQYLKIAGRIGARRMLEKPFTPRHLIALVDEVLADGGGGQP